MNVTSTKAKLFLIRCGINQAVQVPNTEHIIVITDTIPAARYISLICLPIYFNCILSLFFKILEPFLTKGLLTPLCSGIVLAMTSGLLI